MDHSFAAMNMARRWRSILMASSMSSRVRFLGSVSMMRCMARSREYWEGSDVIRSTTSGPVMGLDTLGSPVLALHDGIMGAIIPPDLVQLGPAFLVGVPCEVAHAIGGLDGDELEVFAVVVDLVPVGGEEADMVDKFLPSRCRGEPVPELPD